MSLRRSPPGAAIRNESSSSPTLTNVTIVGNIGSDALYATDGASILANTIVYGEITGSYTAQYSLIEGNSNTDNHNLDASGLTLAHIFTDPGTGDFTLKVGSPAIDKGVNTLIPSGITTDLAGKARIQLGAVDLGAVDLGAYEAAAFPDGQGIVYVTPTGTGNGSAWNNATANLHNAIHASGVKKVFVAIGTYKVGDHSFVMKSGVEIYGGFDPDNGIDDLTDKRILPNKGMGDGSVLDGENVRPVIYNVDNGVDLTAVLDGFTITKGYSSSLGGGIQNENASPTLQNLVVKNNSARVGGGAIYNGPNTSPAVSECIFTSNTSPTLGVVYNSGGPTSSTIFTNCIIEKNHASMGSGALFNRNTSAKYVNCLISGNTGQIGVRFLNTSGATAMLINTTIVGHTGQVVFLKKGVLYLKTA